MKSRKSLIKHFKPNGVGAEIGVLFGDFSRDILSLWNGKLYMIDIWSSAHPDYLDSNNHIHYKKDLAIIKALENIKEFEDRAIMIRATSKEASLLFQNESLDFIHIDANHSYEHTKEDIELWYPKVKDGGMISIHDYILYDDYAKLPFEENGKDKLYRKSLFGVNKAVDEFCFKNKISKNLTTEEPFSTFYFIKTQSKSIL